MIALRDLPSIRPESGRYLSCLVLALLTLGLYQVALDGNWRWDDTQVLSHNLSHSLLDSFSDPSVYGLFSATNLFPWILASFKLDYWLFGNSPGWFYLHQLLAILGCAVLFFLVCTQWMRQWLALPAAVLFVTGAPVAVLSEQLMTRHYLEGLLLALASLYLVTRYLRGGRRILLWLSVFCYLLAVTCKEIYVPLVTVLPLLVDGPWRRRLRIVAPFLMVALLYALWRLLMLDDLLGGYRVATAASDGPMLSAFVITLLRIPQLLFGKFAFAVIGFYSLLLLSSFRQARSGLLLAAVLAAAIFLPLIPLVGFPGIDAPDRYLLLVWLMFCFSTAWCADLLLRRCVHNDGRAGVTVFMALSLVALLFATVARSRDYLADSVLPVAAEYDAQAQFVQSHDIESAFLPGPQVVANYWFMTGLQKFLTLEQGHTSLPRAIVDPIYLNNDIGFLYQYDAACACMQDISGQLADRIASHQATLRPRAPLSVRIRYRDRQVSWQLGPYDSGQYFLVSEQLGTLPMSRVGAAGQYLDDAVLFRLKYADQSGWTTYSPVLELSPRGQWTEWQRGALSISF